MAKFDTSIFKDFKKITVDDMADYIEAEKPDEKHDFKVAAYPNEKDYNHLAARKYFYEKYFPDYIPKAKPEEPKKSDRIKDW